MLEHIHQHWEYVAGLVAIPVGYLVKMILNNNKAIQQIKEEIAKNYVTTDDLAEHREWVRETVEPFKESVKRIDARMSKIDEKMDKVIFEISKQK